MSLKDPLLGDDDWTDAIGGDGHTDIIGGNDTVNNGHNLIHNHYNNNNNNNNSINGNNYHMNYNTSGNNTTATPPMTTTLANGYNNANHHPMGLSSNKQVMSTIAMSSSSDSSTDDIVIPMQRRKVKTRFSRKRRSRSTDSGSSMKSRALTSCPSVCMKIVSFVLIVSSVAFTVLFISKLYDRIDALQTAINDLSNSGNGIPQELHSIHSRMKLLDTNISAIKADVFRAFDSIANLTQEVKQMKSQLNKIADSVEAAPAIRQLPKELQDLQKVVAEMGSRLTTNDNEIKTMKDKQNADQTRSDSIADDLSAIHGNITELYETVDRNGNGSASEARVDHNANQLSQLADNVNHLQQFYKQLINWKTEADEKIRIVMTLTQHIHDKLHNSSLADAVTPAPSGGHSGHAVSHALADDESIGGGIDNKDQVVTTIGSVPANQTQVS